MMAPVPTSLIPPPGAVCPAIVRYGLPMRKSPDTWITPPTRNTHVLAPLVSNQERNDPVPESLRLVTSMTTPPRPPAAPAALPSAPANAGTSSAEEVWEVTEISIEADLVRSASLVAVIVSVAAVSGAVYMPLEVICPFKAFQVTDLSAVVPVMAAVSCNEPPTGVDAAFGVIAMDATADPLSPEPWVGLAGFDDGLDALVGFAVAGEPAQPPVSKKAPKTREVIAKLVVQTAFLNAQIIERGD